MLPTWPTLPRSLLLALTCGLAAGTFACNAVLGIEDTTLGEEGGPGEDYSCLGETPPKPSGLKATITIDASDATEPSVGLAGVSIKRCDGFNVQCLNAITVETNSDGRAPLDVPTALKGFDGFLEISAPTFKTVLWYFSSPVTESFTLRVLMIGDDAFDGLAGSLGVTPDPKQGHITLDIRDCQGVPAPNVSFTAIGLAEGSREFYRLATGFVPAGAGSKTDDSGQVIIFNIPAPATVSVATTNALGTTTAEFGMPIRPDMISTVILTPNQ